MDDIRLELQWQNAAAAQVLAIGDVQDVIHGRASVVQALPARLTHGLGALSTAGPAGSGEGIVVRGRAGIAPPAATAGLLPAYQDATADVATPFFVGWHGQPVAVAGCWGRPDVTLRDLYRALFGQLTVRPDLAARPLILVEIVALLAIEHIHDRALQRPVHNANVDITAPDQAGRFFAHHIIRQDLLRRGYEGQTVLPLTIVGLGLRRPPAAGPAVQRLEQLAFYNPPRVGSDDASGREQELDIKTHSHAIGWFQSGQLPVHLLHLVDTPGRAEPVTATIEEEHTALVETAPDYVVHIDDWSRLVGGLARVYTAGPEHLRFQVAG